MCQLDEIQNVERGQNYSEFVQKNIALLWAIPVTPVAWANKIENVVKRWTLPKSGQGIPSWQMCHGLSCPFFSGRDKRMKEWSEKKRERTQRQGGHVSLFMWQIKKSINHCRRLTAAARRAGRCSWTIYEAVAAVSLSCFQLECRLVTLVGWRERVLSEIFKCLRAFYTRPVAPKERRGLQGGRGLCVWQHAGVHYSH